MAWIISVQHLDPWPRGGQCYIALLVQNITELFFHKLYIVRLDSYYNLSSFSPPLSLIISRHRVYISGYTLFIIYSWNLSVGPRALLHRSAKAKKKTYCKSDKNDYHFRRT